MKKIYFLFFLSALFLNNVSSQKANNEDIHFNLGKVQKNVTSGIKSYNLEDLKHHVKYSKTAINNVIRGIKSTECSNALELSDEISTLLDTALLSEELSTGRYYLKMIQDLINKVFYEYESCTIKDDTTNSSNNSLAYIEEEQSDLELQQIALEKKAAEIKQMLAEQRLKQVNLEKNKFIESNEKAIKSNIKAYNDLLKACNCNATITNTNESTISLKSKDLEEIRTHYIDKTIRISENYLAELNGCKN